MISYLWAYHECIYDIDICPHLSCNHELVCRAQCVRSSMCFLDCSFYHVQFIYLDKWLFKVHVCNMQKDMSYNKIHINSPYASSVLTQNVSNENTVKLRVWSCIKIYHHWYIYIYIYTHTHTHTHIYICIYWFKF